MPLYEYRCDTCGKVIEIIQKFSDPPLCQCAECGGALEKILSAPAIQFKGSGWYVTDYARKNGSNSSSSKEKSGKESKGDSKEESTTNGSQTETKSETKSESKSKTNS